MIPGETRVLSLSIVIPTKNRGDDLIECVRSIVLQQKHPTQIAVVDQSPTPEAQPLLAQLLSQTSIELLYLHDPSIPSAAHARNVAMAHCSGSLVGFLDDDVVLAEDHLAQVLTIFDNDRRQEIGGIGVLITNRKVSRLTLLWTHVFNRGYLKGRRIKASFYAGRTSNQSQLVGTDCLAGCCYYRKGALDGLGFDESYRGYSLGEDVILSYQVSRKHRLYFSPAVQLLHKVSPINRATIDHIHKMEVFFEFYFFARYVPKTPSTTSCFLWLNVGMLARNLYDVIWRPRSLSVPFEAFASILRVVLRRRSIVEELQALQGAR